MNRHRTLRSALYTNVSLNSIILVLHVDNRTVLSNYCIQHTANTHIWLAMSLLQHTVGTDTTDTSV